MTQFMLACLSVASLNQLDITASGLDYWVGWVAAGGDRAILSSMGAEATLSGGYGSTSLTLMNDTAGVPTCLIVMSSSEDPWSDSAKTYMLDPTTLTTLGSIVIPYAEICPPAKFHDGCSIIQLGAQSVIDDDTDCVFFASVRTNYTLTGAQDGVSHYTWHCAAILDTDDSGQTAFREQAVLDVLFGCDFVPPVQTDPSYWVSGYGGYGGTYPPYSYVVQATGYDGSSGSGTLDCSTLDWFYGASPTDATAYCAGNCSAGAVIVWENYEGVDQYSLISSTSSPVPDMTLEMPSWPDEQPPLFAAMSDVRDDPGALLAWYDGEHIWCRYFDGQWNDWCHQLSAEEPVDFSTGYLGACSAQDGYYVAWLEDGSDDPTVVYVLRSGVVGIEGSSPEAGELLLRPSSNPFTSSVTVLCSGPDVPDQLIIYDVTGRLVRDLTDRQGSSFLWDGCDGSGTDVPTGTYLIQGAVEGEMSTLRIVRL